MAKSRTWQRLITALLGSVMFAWFFGGLSTLTWMWPLGMIVLAMLNWDRIQARRRSE